MHNPRTPQKRLQTQEETPRKQGDTMCRYGYIYIYICIYLYVCIYVYIYIYIYIVFDVHYRSVFSESLLGNLGISI